MGEWGGWFSCGVLGCWKSAVLAVGPAAGPGSQQPLAHAAEAPAVPLGMLREEGKNTSSVTRLQDSWMEDAKNSTMVLDMLGFLAMLSAVSLPPGFALK